MSDFTNREFDLTGKVAIVTGAGGRGNSIGRAYAVALANAGAEVVVADINEDGAQTVVDEIVANKGRAIAVRVDITDTASVQAMADATVAAFGGVDILVNNAALMVEMGASGVMNTGKADFDRFFAVNLWGAINCAQIVAPRMAARGGEKWPKPRVTSRWMVVEGTGPATKCAGPSRIRLRGVPRTPCGAARQSLTEPHPL